MTSPFRPDTVGPWATAARALGQPESSYRKRAKDAYWRPATVESCDARGPRDGATCLLDPDHRGGQHFGNGFDQWGPKGPYAWPT